MKTDAHFVSNLAKMKHHQQNGPIRFVRTFRRHAEVMLLMDSLTQLVTEAQAGGIEAFGQLVHRFQMMAYGYACSISGDAQLAEDAVQEAFIEAFDRLGTLSHPLAFPAYLRRIVLKHCDRQSRRQRPNTMGLASLESGSLACEPSRIVGQRELYERVRRAVAMLPERQRELTSLFYMHGCSQLDISAFLDLPIGTIKKQLQQARKMLRHRMLAVAHEAFQQNYLDQSFATHIVAGLLSRTQLLRVAGHPVRRLWDQIQSILSEYDVVETDVVENVDAARSYDCDKVRDAFHIDRRQVLRSQVLGSLWPWLRRRQLPIRLLTAGRVFCDCAEGRQTTKVSHQIEGVSLDRSADVGQLKTMVTSLLSRLLHTRDIRWLEIPSSAFETAYRIAVRNQHGLYPVGLAGVLNPDLLRRLQIGEGETQGLAFALGLERIAALQQGIRDVRELWGPKYCPGVGNHNAIQLNQNANNRFCLPSHADAATLSGEIPGGGHITPGRSWMSRDGILHVRGQTIADNRIEGGFVGSETIDLNMDLNHETGAGQVRNTTRAQGEFPGQSLRGRLIGDFIGEIRDGGVFGHVAFKGSGGLAGIEFVAQVSTSDLVNEPFQYEGAIIDVARNTTRPR